ncbi:hypothetical protein [Rhodobacter sp. NSM]|uniref:hypothetical protein n=1 Tax=Rhodobacter sp. NSM TaxID=3457501 RepID=UPI003FD3E3D1
MGVPSAVNPFRTAPRTSTAPETIAAVRHLALIASDNLIAGILNRNGLLTGHGNRWMRERVTALRPHHRIPVFRPAPDGIEPWLNLTDAARLLGVSPRTVRIAAEAGVVEGNHPLSAARGSSGGPNLPHQGRSERSKPGRRQNSPQDRILTRRTHSLNDVERWVLCNSFVMLAPGFDCDPGLGQTVEDLSVQQFVAKLRVEASQ